MSISALRVLVADDELTTRLVLKAALEKSGFDVVQAVDGEDALRQFVEKPCNVVMLDVDMPGLNGFQVCLRLRQTIGNELPIIMVTGMDDAQSVERAFDAGATDFIAKPLNLGRSAQAAQGGVAQAKNSWAAYQSQNRSSQSQRRICKESQAAQRYTTACFPQPQEVGCDIGKASCPHCQCPSRFHPQAHHETLPRKPNGGHRGFARQRNAGE